MKYITVKLTQDQAQFIDNLLQDHIICAGVRQSPARTNFAKRISTKLTGVSYDVDHSSSENIINAKLASGELKFPQAKTL